MLHLHLKKCESTQTSAFELINEGHDEVLVSCEEQSGAQGRRSRFWLSAEQSIAISFNLNPNQVATLTSLELGVLTMQFLEREFGKEVYLKWPNDLYTKEGKKCAGILAQNRHSILVAGIGVNIFHPQEKIPEELREKMGPLFSSPQDFDAKASALKLYQYIMRNRLYPEALRRQWNERCLHLNKVVEAIEDGKSIKGVFRGIGEHGQALLETEGGVEQIYNATLKI